MTEHDPPPPRVLPLSGATNFRDLGGYRGLDGRPLRWRRLFRSEQLGALTAADHEVLAALGVAAAFDFRGVDERAAAPYAVPGLAQHSLAIEPTVAQHMQAIADSGRTLTGPVVQGLMKDLYRGLVDARAPRFAEFFAHLLGAEAPLVFHCTAGKDRTGVAAALVLLALGVPRETVMQDYLLTNEVFKPPWAPRADIAPEVLQALWGVQPDYLEAALEMIDREHGGPERYLERVIGLDGERRRRLERRYLQPR
ncbi:MAG: tyrosine-protein phosphatase [Rubrivivax sp.]|nr:tyrosine-protein phosphatase [Rubrivivax sp.]